MSSAERLPVLDGLRAISILLVLGTHMLPLGPKVLQLNVTTGLMGMSLFFALSGFLITSGLLRNDDVHEFLVRRLVRIVPLAYAYAFIVFTFIIFEPKTLFWTSTFLINYYPEYINEYNGHFWSLCVEMQFYMAVAFAVALGRKKVLWLVWPACVAVTAWRISQEAYFDIRTDVRVDEILAGACLATVYQSSWRGRFRQPAAMVVLAALLWFVASCPFAGWCMYFRPYAAVFLVGVVLSLDKDSLTNLLASRPMRYIARISYALYVIHPVTAQGWWNEGSIFDKYVLKRPISFAITFFLAHLSTFHWEQLWLNAGKRRIEQRRQRFQSAA
jgi:peptidoglycan/LPS O-acetylase OafA/YrhL